MNISLITLFCLISLSAYSQVTSFIINDDVLNKPLKDSLESIYKSDQSVRIAVSEALKSKKPKEYIDSLRAVMRQTDIINLRQVKKIIKEKGWQSPQMVGMNAAQGLFLVIQHADLQTQLEYLLMIQEVEKKGEILSSNLAILEDRINVRQGKIQFYGSQVFIDRLSGKQYPYPIADVDNLDTRRKSMGMPSMQTYLKDWDTERYKKDLPMIEQLVKAQGIR
ncbi:DUF6624 domain-containing protein [Pedobacter agri]|uniref:DUF6624 domain-containing protein n=1 Tax=Pedobacter agri TaxID=454586 RepID=UPI00292D115B|nr:DUF6624 domain-containing protein [Pedobacter agri]